MEQEIRAEALEEWNIHGRGVTAFGVQQEQNKANDHSIIVHIQGWDDRDLARLHTNEEIAVPIEALPKLESEEFYWSQLIGLIVVDQKGASLGEVIEILETRLVDGRYLWQ